MAPHFSARSTLEAQIRALDHCKGAQLGKLCAGISWRAMAFWGCEVKPGKPTPFVPPPEAARLHLSQACLSIKAKPGAKAALTVKVSEEGQELLVCCLREGATESLGLDLIFDQYTEFSVVGTASIHLTGYYMPEYEMGEESEEEDEEDGPHGAILGFDEYGVPVLAHEYDSQEDSDYETESSEEDEEMVSDEDGDLNPPRRVIIEDVTEAEQQRRAAKALPAHAAGGKAAQFEGDGVGASDEEEEEEEDSEEEGEEEGSDEEESESESEDEEQKLQAKQQQQAGQKRKAEQQPPAAKQQPAKAAKQQPEQQKQKAAAPAAKQQQQQPGKQQAAVTPAAAEKQQQKEPPGSATKSKIRKFPNGFEIEDLKMGRPDGKLAKAGKKVVMRYVGRLKSNGKVFDQTKGNATFAFRLGVGEVIKGWDRGVEGMRVGDKRRLTIPPQMAYGSSGVRGAIPPNAWLVFEVELVDVK